MIIDAHCHLPKDLNLNAFFKDKEDSKIDKSVLILNTDDEQEAFIKQFDIAKPKLSKLSILIGYDYKNPNLISNLNFFDKKNIPYGLKLHSRLMNFTINDIPKIIDSIKQSNSNIIMIDGFTYGENIETHIFLPLLINVAREFTNRKLVFAHAGGIEILRTMLCTRQLKNVFYDLSLTVPYLFDTSIHQDIIHFIRFNKNRVMFGSDSPDFTTKYALEKFYSIFNEMSLDHETIENILYNNANTIYKEIWN